MAGRGSDAKQTADAIAMQDRKTRRTAGGIIRVPSKAHYERTHCVWRGFIEALFRGDVNQSVMSRTWRSCKTWEKCPGEAILTEERVLDRVPRLALKGLRGGIPQ